MKVTEYRDGLPTPEVSESEAVLRFGLNEDGRDFVVGDIHGMFQHLTELLEQIEFDEGSDRLFSVGDLVDRGPESHRALEWLDKPWFYERKRGQWGGLTSSKKVPFKVGSDEEWTD